MVAICIAVRAISLIREILDDLKMRHFVCQVYCQLFFTSSD